MTSKATEDHIKKLQKSGALTLFEPELVAGEAHTRRLWLHPEVRRWVDSAGTDDKEAKYFDDVRAFLKNFDAGGELDEDVDVKLLKPPGECIHEMRITFNPAFRIFGAFLRPGEFVALCHDSKGQLNKHGYGKCRTTVKTRWDGMFGKIGRLDASFLTLTQEFDDECAKGE